MEDPVVDQPCRNCGQPKAAHLAFPLGVDIYYVCPVGLYEPEPEPPQVDEWTPQLRVD